jgi:hypothetical protein
LSDVIGSWKIIEISAPRRLRSSPAEADDVAAAEQDAARRIDDRILGRKEPRIASEVTDLPLPDSPTSATVEFFGMSNEIPLTASKSARGRAGTRPSGS